MFPLIFFVVLRKELHEQPILMPEHQADLVDLIAAKQCYIKLSHFISTTYYSCLKLLSYCKSKRKNYSLSSFR